MAAKKLSEFPAMKRIDAGLHASSMASGFADRKEAMRHATYVTPQTANIAALQLVASAPPEKPTLGESKRKSSG